jgi:two-component system response regulator (stage 0 sporulation protein F)
MGRDIFVADGDTCAREKFFKVLSSMGHKVDCMPNSNEAIFQLQTRRPYLLILDQDLPPDGGLKALERIRIFDKLTRILFLTKEETDIDAQICLEARRSGASEVLKKDFSSYTMFKKIEEMLGVAEEKGDGDKYLNLGRILVLDDDPGMRMTLEAFLNKKGFHVMAVADGEQALKEIGVQKTKIVICDERMPGMDGLMVLRKIKEFDKSINVIMLTAVGDEDVVREATALGASGFLNKPCNLQDVEKMILSLLIQNI